MHNSVEYSDISLKTSGILWQYNIDEAALDNDKNIFNFPANNNSIFLKFKQKITGQTENKKIFK